MVNGNCAVFNCTNSQYRIRKWKKQACKEHDGLTHEECPCQQPFTLHTFPSVLLNSDKRREWIRLMNRTTVKNTAWCPGKSDVVCSDHFVDKRPTLENPNPVLNLGYEKPAKKPRRELHRRQLSPVKRKEREQEAEESPEHVPEKEPCHECLRKETEIESLTDRCLKKETEIESLIKKVDSLSIERDDLSQKVTEVTVKVHRLKEDRRPFSVTSIKTDAKMKFFTGLQTVAVFGILFNLLKPFIQSMNFWRGDKQTRKVVTSKLVKRRTQKITAKDQLLLVLMRLRLGLFMEDLADRFCISVGTCSGIFCTWIKLLSKVLGDALIVWLPRESISTNLPFVFQAKNAKTRCIIDCTELYITRPKSVDNQASTWSDYKKHNTVKFLVVISPNGFVMYISDCYGGRTSDRYICQDSAFYNFLEAGDEVMADRGFQIKEDLLHYFCSLSIPPGARTKDQMPPGDCEKTKDVANLRIHVERAINRIKDFKILKSTMPLTVVPLADDIVRTCAALCNIQSYLIKDK